ncbi:hypothetical protein HYZ99_03525 [Candidatus Peregrinibacteria bacterium]|nr:hypothetical protein [Candidatus Peregrinibacteria bacterium]
MSPIIRFALRVLSVLWHLAALMAGAIVLFAETEQVSVLRATIVALGLTGVFALITDLWGVYVRVGDDDDLDEEEDDTAPYIERFGGSVEDDPYRDRPDHHEPLGQADDPGESRT